MSILDKLGFSPARWENGALIVLDQRTLPESEKYLRIKSVDETAEAIGNLTVRGAPLIGIIAAYGLCLVSDPFDDQEFENACEKLLLSRPTAVNLSWAVRRMISVRDKNRDIDDLRAILLTEAETIHREDAFMCEKIGEFGNDIIPQSCRILTHCNAGVLATGGI
ncbi:MAG: S-methyl-5-thioribose-1-phosphate isomerase, partial [candidate division Zixibacteria bacterium]